MKLLPGSKKLKCIICFHTPEGTKDVPHAPKLSSKRFCNRLTICNFAASLSACVLIGLQISASGQCLLLTTGVWYSGTIGDVARVLCQVYRPSILRTSSGASTPLDRQLQLAQISCSDASFFLKEFFEAI